MNDTSLMYLVYYDEVKYDPPAQTSFWLGGIAVPDASVREIEEQVNEVADEAFRSRILTKATEFHGKEICGGKGNFKGQDLDTRLDVLSSLLAIIAREDVKRLIVKINPANIVYNDDPPAEIAFMYFVEGVQNLLSKTRTIGMMFGDYDEPVIGSSVASLSKYRRGGTGWARGIQIDRIVDTVHFAKSHHSRMIQLADVFLYCCQFCLGDNTAEWRRRVHSTIVRSRIMQEFERYKNWPQEARWYQGE